MPGRNCGFTDSMALKLVRILILTIVLSFILSVLSIRYQYLGPLACWTACIAPLQVGLSIVLSAVVNKNKAENTSADGDGIRYRQIIGTNGEDVSI